MASVVSVGSVGSVVIVDSRKEKSMSERSIGGSSSSESSRSMSMLNSGRFSRSRSSVVSGWIQFSHEKMS